MNVWSNAHLNSNPFFIARCLGSLLATPEHLLIPHTKRLSALTWRPRRKSFCKTERTNFALWCSFSFHSLTACNWLLLCWERSSVDSQHKDCLSVVYSEWTTEISVQFLIFYKNVCMLQDFVGTWGNLANANGKCHCVLVETEIEEEKSVLNEVLSASSTIWKSSGAKRRPTATRMGRMSVFSWGWKSLAWERKKERKGRKGWMSELTCRCVVNSPLTHLWLQAEENTS